MEWINCIRSSEKVEEEDFDPMPDEREDAAEGRDNVDCTSGSSHTVSAYSSPSSVSRFPSVQPTFSRSPTSTSEIPATNSSSDVKSFCDSSPSRYLSPFEAIRSSPSELLEPFSQYPTPSSVHEPLEIESSSYVQRRPHSHFPVTCVDPPKGAAATLCYHPEQTPPVKAYALDNSQTITVFSPSPNNEDTRLFPVSALHQEVFEMEVPEGEVSGPWHVGDWGSVTPSWVCGTEGDWAKTSSYYSLAHGEGLGFIERVSKLQDPLQDQFLGKSGSGVMWETTSHHFCDISDGCGRGEDECSYVDAAWTYSMEGTDHKPSHAQESVAVSTTTTAPGTTFFSNKKAESKVCGVCGDRALGYNFNAITCESCKAFFRRNALKKKEFRCPFQESCKVDVVTRRFCQKCRLRKCFEIGMKKEWIMSDEEKQRKKQKIEENRARKIGSETAEEDDEEEEEEENSSDTVHKTSPMTVHFPPFLANPDMSKPQAVVVGVMREDGGTTQITKDSIKKVTDEKELEEGHGKGADFISFLNLEPAIFSAASVAPNNISVTVTTMQPSSLTTTTTTTSSPTPSPTAMLNNLSTPKLSPQHGKAEGNLHACPPIQIKKEAEESEDSGPTTTAVEDQWKDFKIQDALQLLQRGCKEQKSPSGLSVLDSVMTTAISAEYSTFSLIGGTNPRELNEPERVKLAELYEANKALLAPLCEDYNFKQDMTNPSLINVINLTDIAIRRLIKMSKRISSFKSLCQEDQIALLKGGCTEMMILRSVSAYDPDKDSWKIQQDHDRYKNIKLKVLKAAQGNVYEEHKRFILAFNQEWRQDHNIMLLLSAIALFTPDRPNIIHSEAIRHEQCSYLYLLKRYLECKYGGCEGRTIYCRLLERVNHLHILNENHVRVFLEVNPQEVEPLLIEIFDLKQR
ncbi:nuclear hormone receptor HR96-like [Oratosquilla oratoria]|uniref:nuclear hormone receptor HR96-like n=1 Tax=Oratosquilla oratoria TaxID=337810 RepID=UPI003F75C1B0